MDGLQETAKPHSFFGHDVWRIRCLAVENPPKQTVLLVWILLLEHASVWYCCYKRPHAYYIRSLSHNRNPENIAGIVFGELYEMTG